MENFDNKINEFKQHYNSRFQYYNSALTFLNGLIGSLPGVDSVSGRIKDYEECLSKFERKYLPNIDRENTDYNIIDYLSDFIGIRVVCFYLEDIGTIRKELKKHFREIKITDKAFQLEKTDDKFGYKSLHLDLMLKNTSRHSNDFKKYKTIKFELQIRTIIQDAWSVLDHKIKYKKSIPQSLKRRINRLSALFEIADDEFLSIKEEIVSAEKKINERIKRGAVVEKDKSLDVFRFLFIALKYFPDYNFIEFKVDGFVQEILTIKNDLSESDLNEAVLSFLPVAEQIAKNENKLLNPYTKIRYCLFLFDKSLFSNILSDYQRETLKRINKSIV